MPWVPESGNGPRVRVTRSNNERIGTRRKHRVTRTTGTVNKSVRVSGRDRMRQSGVLP